MRKITLLIAFALCIHVCFAQSFFKSLPKISHTATVNSKVGARVTATDSTFFAFRPVLNIAAMAIPSFSAMAGAGIGVQNLTYNFTTQRYYCNFSINGIMFAGGNIAPAKPTPTLTYAIMLGFLNNTIMVGPGLNGGKIQGIISLGISLNN